MTGEERLRFIVNFWPGLLLTVIYYTALTAYRDFRDNFAPQLWEKFGWKGSDILLYPEIVIALIVMVPMCLPMLVKGNMRGFMIYHGLIVGGMILSLIFTLLYQLKILKGHWGGFFFMTISGLGLYLGYIPFNSLLYDLLIAAFQYKANVGFLTYFCDSCGYMGSVTVMLVESFAIKGGGGDMDTKFYTAISFGVSAGGIVLMTLVAFYWMWKERRWHGEVLVDGRFVTIDTTKLLPGEN
jgi:hypothetical protein